MTSVPVIKKRTKISDKKSHAFFHYLYLDKGFLWAIFFVFKDNKSSKDYITWDFLYASFHNAVVWGQKKNKNTVTENKTPELVTTDNRTIKKRKEMMITSSKSFRTPK